MISRIAFVLSILLFCSSLWTRIKVTLDQKKESRILEWKLDRDWKLQGISAQAIKALKTLDLPLTGELQISRKKSDEFKPSGKNSILRDLGSRLQEQLGTDDLLTIKWNPLNAPDPSLPLPPLLTPSPIRLDVSLYSLSLGKNTRTKLSSFLPSSTQGHAW
ncbi:hypothetical protein HOF92_03880 [bacterium]|jgi:hypothetical protein|nr:hypothetical protein [bacterium]